MTTLSYSPFEGSTADIFFDVFSTLSELSVELKLELSIIGSCKEEVIPSFESERASSLGSDSIGKALLISLWAHHVTCSKQPTDGHSLDVGQDGRRSSARVNAMIILVVDVLDQVFHKFSSDLFGSEWARLRVQFNVGQGRTYVTKAKRKSKCADSAQICIPVWSEQRLNVKVVKGARNLIEPRVGNLKSRSK